MIAVPLTFSFLDDAHRYRQIEAAWPGAGRVEEPHAADAFVVREMTVTEYDQVGGIALQRTRDAWIGAVRAGKNVRQQNMEVAQHHPLDVLTGAVVVVAGNGRDRGDAPQRLQNLFASDVASVQNMVDIREYVGDAFVDAAVGVRDDSDTHVERVTAGTRTARWRLQMTTKRDDDARADFAYFSNEYAQALQALDAIEKQSSTLLLLGSSDELREFVEQFLEMATRVRKLALEKDEPNFAEWFGELVDRAEALRGTIAQQEQQ